MNTTVPDSGWDDFPPGGCHSSSPSVSIDFKEFNRQKWAWSQEAFGPISERGPVGPLKHLEKEIKEVLEKPDDLEEYVDCIFLIMDAAYRAGFTYEQIMQGCWIKLAKNKQRTWVRKPGSGDQPIEHDRSGEQSRT